MTVAVATKLLVIMLTVALGWLAWRLWRQSATGADSTSMRRFGLALAGLLLAQVFSGLSNVVLGWPLIAALGHSAGAAGLVLVLSLLLARSVQTAPLRASASRPAAVPA